MWTRRARRWRRRCAARIAAEEGCGPEPARERTRQLVEGLDRPKPKRGSGGKGKRREAACARRLSEIRDREIAHELRWNRCLELAASLELTAIEASLLSAVSMFCVTRAFVCWETRAELMALARIKTNASFAAAVAALMRRGLLVPVDGAPRTEWYLGESFWGGLLAGEELDTPVAKLARGRRRAAERQAGPRRAGQRGSVGDGAKDSGAVGAEVEDRPSKGSGEAPSPGEPGPEEPESGSGSVENRTSDAAGQKDAGTGETQTARGGRKSGGKGRKGAVPKRPAANRREKVTVARFVAEELADDPHRAKIEQRLKEFFGRLGEKRVARARQAGTRGAGARRPDGGCRRRRSRKPARGAAAGWTRPIPRRWRCRECGQRFDAPGTGGDRGDGVCRACDLHPPSPGGRWTSARSSTAW